MFKIASNPYNGQGYLETLYTVDMDSADTSISFTGSYNGGLYTTFGVARYN
jgi:hypothetical protein